MLPLLLFAALSRAERLETRQAGIKTVNLASLLPPMKSILPELFFSCLISFFLGRIHLATLWAHLTSSAKMLVMVDLFVLHIKHLGPADVHVTYTQI